jgi:tetratricopeptide (TPR) repeat protein
MSFGGSVLSMITSLKNNANILPKRRTFRDRKRDYAYKLSESLKFKELPENELLVIKAKIKKKIRRERIIRMIIRLSILSLFLILSGFLIVDKYQNYINRQDKKERELKIIAEKKNQKQALLIENTILFYLNKGNTFLAKEDYYNAKDMYARALEYDNEDYQLLLAYTKAYIYDCVYNDIECDKAVDLLNGLKRKYGITIEVIDLMELYAGK